MIGLLEAINCAASDNTCHDDDYCRHHMCLLRSGYNEGQASYDRLSVHVGLSEVMFLLGLMIWALPSFVLGVRLDFWHSNFMRNFFLSFLKVSPVRFMVKLKSTRAPSILSILLLQWIWRERKLFAVPTYEIQSRICTFLPLLATDLRWTWISTQQGLSELQLKVSTCICDFQCKNVR